MILQINLVSHVKLKHNAPVYYFQFVFIWRVRHTLNCRDIRVSFRHTQRWADIWIVRILRIQNLFKSFCVIDVTVTHHHFHRVWS